MLLSVVIVSFNVKYFLEQCLHALEKAVSESDLLRADTEVLIVDNASTDGTVEFLEPLFPMFRFISNTENKGFSRANNQVLPDCAGKYILFLNPDTVVAEDSLSHCISFFEEHQDAGALGVRMIDGCGRFLKESKRGFPSASASFFKMSGLARAFPSSRRFAAYYAGHLDASVDQAIEVLSGAFMMVRKNLLDETGGFDEQFFMYAEDIDLSYRILQAGYRNYYLGGTAIIHFKGESTRRDLRYVRHFHLAMKQFMRKHVRGIGASMLMLNFGIAVKQGMALASFKLKKKSPVAVRRQPVFIQGTDDLIPARKALKATGMAATDSPFHAGEWLYCEGGKFSFKAIIGEMDRRQKKIPCYIHGAGTHAAVGGSPGDIQGEAIIF